MKKTLFILNLILLPILTLGITCGILFSLPIVKSLAIITMILLASVNLCFNSLHKSKSIYFGVLIIIAMLFTLISTQILNSNFKAGAILLCLSVITILIATIINEKFEYTDLIYMAAIAIPTIIMFIFTPIFGFAETYIKILILLYMTIVAALFGKSIADLKKGCNLTRVMIFIASLFIFIFNLLLMMRRFSNISFKFDLYIYTLSLIPLIFLTFTIFTTIKPYSNLLTKTNLKKHITSTILIMLTAFLTFYAFSGSMILFNVASAKVSKDEFLSKVGKNLEIPIVEISTQYNLLPTNKEDYINCSFSISNCEDSDHNFSVSMAKSFDDENDFQNSVGIRLRGNSTMRARKRPYRIKFEEKQSLFGLKKNKSWVLLADYYDQSYIRNYTAFTLADSFDNLQFSPTAHHVALVINGEFQGLYLLCEQMDENKGRTNVKEDFDITDKDFPFLVEMDISASTEGITGIDNFYIPDINHVEIKYPEAADRNATSEQDVVYNYIYEYMNAVFTTIKTNEKVQVSFRNTPVGLEDLVDLDSAVDYYLVNEIMLNIDSAWKSIYFHKPKNGKLVFGPVWDFDFSMTTELVAPFEKSYIEGTESLWLTENSVVFRHLIKNETFYNKVTARFNEKKDTIIQTFNHLKDYKAKIDNVAVIDSQMWHGITGEFQYDMQYDYVRLFLMDRYNFLTEIFSKSHTEFLALLENS